MLSCSQHAVGRRTTRCHPCLSAANLYLFFFFLMECNEFCFWRYVMWEAWRIMAQAGLFTLRKINCESLNKTHLKLWCLTDGAPATGCDLLCAPPAFTSLLQHFSPVKDFFLGHPSFFLPPRTIFHPLCAAGHESAPWERSGCCDRLPWRGVIPRARGSNRVIYYTVQLLSSPSSLPNPLYFTPSVLQLLASSALASAVCEDKPEVEFSYATFPSPPLRRRVLFQ